MHGRYLERYLGGEEQTVWHEIVALGGTVREEPLSSETVAIVQEFLRRARINLDLLVTRLRSLGYQFWTEQDGDPPVSELTPADLAEVQDLETSYGPLPLVLRMWHEQIGLVNFSGYHPKLSASYRLVPSDLGSPTRPPESDPFSVTLLFWENTGAPRRVEVVNDPCSKVGVCPEEGWCMLLPCVALDAPLIYDKYGWSRSPITWTEGQLFGDYVRTAFQWGGFYEFRRDPVAAEAARKELAFLTQDLLPI